MFKNNLAKRFLSSVLALVMLVSGTAIGLIASADDGVAINSVNFKDDIWRGIVADYLDPNSDGTLSPSEISAVTLIDVSGFLEAKYGEDTPVEINDLTGIEHFTALRTLRVGGIGLETLNVYPLVALRSLTCQGNYLESLNLLNNEELIELNCSANFIKSLLVSLNTNLTKLICHTNEIKSIDLTHNAQLEYLSIFQNELTTLNLSANPLLSTLNCSNNHLKTLDLSGNPLLSEINEDFISNQTVSAVANYSAEDGSIYADFDIDNSSRIVSTSLDRVEEFEETVVYVKGYDGSSFVTYEPEQILEGIDYYYNVNLEGAANMRVHVNVSKDFYIVRYYDSEALENKIGEEVVNGGASATFTNPEAPLCKTFIQWNDELSEINSDIQTYAIWQDNHNLQRSFENGTVHITCSKGCGLDESYIFSESINARTNDDNFVSYLDVNSDGIINAKDFARLLKG